MKIIRKQKVIWLVNELLYSYLGLQAFPHLTNRKMNKQVTVLEIKPPGQTAGGNYKTMTKPSTV